jgi:hypothetical protein
MRPILLALAVLTASCRSGSIAVPPGPPAATASGGRPRCPDCIPGHGLYQLRVCVVSQGRLLEVPVQYNPTNGDSTYLGKAFREAFPLDGSYAATHRWYVDGEMLPIEGRRLPLEKYGLTRVLQPEDLQRWGTYDGVPLFVETGDTSGVANVVYVPVRPGCEFQQYLQAYSVGGVRG